MAMGEVSRDKVKDNSISLSAGIPGYSLTTGTSTMVLVSMLKTIMADLFSQV